MNGMRGAAALAVAAFHAHPLFGMQVVPGGYLAVDLFFVLSGCVIAHAYDAKLGAGMRTTDFMKIRLVRFMPFYLVGLAFGLVLALALIVTGSPYAIDPLNLALAVFFALFFMPLPSGIAGGGGDMFPLNVPAWSLFYEFVVNALFAIFFCWLTPVVLASVACLSAFVLVSGVWVHGGTDFGPTLSDAPVALSRTLFSFAVGVLIYRFRCPVRTNSLIVIFAVTILFVVPVSEVWRPTFDLACILFIFPVTVFTLLGVETSSAAQDRAFTFLGDMSYGLYAIHYPLIWLLRGASEKLDFDPRFAGLALLAVLVIGCAVVERRIDQPLRIWLTKHLVPNTGTRLAPS